MHVLVERKHRVQRITLNRPEKRNALTATMCAAIVEGVESVQSDDSIGSVLISGAGHVFCAGMDIEEAPAYDKSELADLHCRLFSLGRNAAKPIIVAVNGAALGGGLGLAVQGHIVVASSGAAFGLPEIKIGLWPMLVYQSIEAALGSRRTLELSLTGRLFDAEDALAWGLVSKICHPEEVPDRAKGLANDLAKASPKAIEAGFALRRRSHGASYAETMQAAVELRDSLMETADFAEGVTAFQQKREPRWPSLPQ